MQTHAGSVFASSFCELLWACLHGLCGSCFAGVLQLLWFLQSFLPLFKEISWSLNGETQWRPLCFMPSSCLAVCLCTRFHLLPEGASQLTITQEADMWMYQRIYRSHFIGLFFQVMFVSSLGLLTYPVSDFWSSGQSMVWAPSHTVGLKLNQCWLLPYFSAAIAPAHLAGKIDCRAKVSGKVDVQIFETVAYRVPSCAKETRT